MKTAKKILKWSGWAAAGLALFLLFCFSTVRPSASRQWGVSFSVSYARFLGLDWKAAYGDVLDQLHPRVLRLMAYWDELEPQRGTFRFDDIDYQLQEAQKRGIPVLLVVGRKQPRWPECHEPSWAESLSESEQKNAINDMLRQVVGHARAFHNIAYWQVENEPLFGYGPGCLTISKARLSEEIAIVRSLDARPVVVTDSGEKGWWLPAALSGADVLGSTMYREAYYEKQQQYKTYPIPAWVYRLRAGVVNVFSRVHGFMNVELQAEPWFVTDANSTPWEQQSVHMNPALFADNVAYARRAGFTQNYLWGAEWWYWARSRGHGELWQAARALMKENN